jgi:hypothetical protein
MKNAGAKQVVKKPGRPRLSAREVAVGTTVRLTSDLDAKISMWAKRKGVSRSDAIRALIGIGLRHAS